MEEDQNTELFSSYLGTDPVLDMGTDSGLSYKTKAKSNPQVTESHTKSIHI